MAREDEANKAAVRGSEYDFMVTIMCVDCRRSFVWGSGDGMCQRWLREKLMAGTTETGGQEPKDIQIDPTYRIQAGWAGFGLLSADTALLAAAPQNRIDC